MAKKKKTSKRKSTRSSKASAGKRKSAKKKTSKKKASGRRRTSTKASSNGGSASTTKAKSSRKKKAASTTASSSRASGNGDRTAEGPLTDAQLRKVKTDLTRKDKNMFKRLLLEKRAELVGDVESLQTDALDNAGISYEHMADTGTDNYDQEFTLGLVESERELLREIDEALVRMQNKTYGVCVESGVPIRRARLEIKPWAKYCIDVARDRERRGLKS